MKDQYDPILEDRIHDFMSRKTLKYPELRLLDGAGASNARLHRRADSPDVPPRVIIYER